VKYIFDKDIVKGRLNTSEFDVLLVPGGGVGDGNQNDSDYINFSLDTHPPQIVIEGPTLPSAFYNDTNIVFNISTSDMFTVNRTKIQLFSANTLIFLEENLTGVTEMYINWTDMPNGNYSVNATT
jgi:hypothetical protein